ncbi:LysE family translocator [Shimia aestuarii]|uniref:Threonine/homoserine/homoserine lactone efflux protein n=1 Tax=Shimia aestuarii TaxID=254406 RepID=A0A1I4T308_9RHOB|nr:LysE family translocator [Shimia aestuarii]SFM71066.1 Threonine/homoserine/homoserine lactone efflux protein [Shimia aestuarii]
MSVALASFSVFAASQVGTPGPANMALLATGARYGFRAALPFVAGVALGKQLIIWPIGFGLMSLAETVPGLFLALKWISAAYICWLAWRVAHLRLDPDGARVEEAPGFVSGLWVHPLNPKAWAMIVTGFTSFVTPDTPTFQATATIALCLLATQAVFHPIWTLAGDRIARLVAGRPAERYLMGTLAALTVASVLYVVF